MKRHQNRVAEWACVISAAAVAVVLAGCGGLAPQAGSAHRHDAHPVASRSGPPPPGGYFTLLPAGSYAWLPDDAAAAARVHRSSWEVRPGNAKANHTVPPRLALRPVDAGDGAYDPRWNRYILGRITGHFKGTTDEIFQWAAAKWGVPDNLIRAIAYMESGWDQSNYGDLVLNRRECPSRFALPCPVTFGVTGTKSTSWPGIYPWNRESTATAADVLGGWLRGCYEGWVWWLRDYGNRSHGGYRAGDIWGCVGAWSSGDWHDGSGTRLGSGENYAHVAQQVYKAKPWLSPGF